MTAPDEIDDRVCDRFILWLAAHEWRVALYLAACIVVPCWVVRWLP